VFYVINNGYQQKCINKKNDIADLNEIKNYQQIFVLLTVAGVLNTM